MRVLDVIASASVGLLVGTELAVSLFVNPVLWRVAEKSQAIAIREFAGRLGGTMPYWYGANLLLLIGEAVVHRHDPDRYMLYTAVALWAATILLTILFLVPINSRLASPSTEYRFDSFIQQHRLWDKRHRLRIFVVACAYVLLLFSVAK